MSMTDQPAVLSPDREHLPRNNSVEILDLLHVTPRFSGFQLIEMTVLTCSFALSLPSLWPGCWWTPTYTEYWFYLSVQGGMGV